jgi:23S rRNA (cytidine1920-2'-O)/16S rRNA (cytidine1409-2'-O)-methyltransferase
MKRRACCWPAKQPATMPAADPIAPRGRADQMLVQLGHAESRERARQMIAEQAVRADGRIVDKPARLINADSQIEIASQLVGWVSRAALKLQAGLDQFSQCDPAGKICLDLGASTGGFSQLLLQRGARRVYAVDVGSGQLHSDLQGFAGLVSLEKTDARQLTAALIPEAPQLITADLSFISLQLALGPSLGLAAPQCQLLVLVKPQFELGPKHLAKGGIVRDAAARQQAVARIADWLAEHGWQPRGVIESPLAGRGGNQEYLLAAEKAS